ncbi:helix-turn-helix transcriptional regulator [Falsigemmobacter intermedius]|uniref:helix-turn-helix transcriptional regulator n=1 Tax=Falsigemmobacter intermedius TaxID=1553448 RepID=UPI003EFF0564
MTDALSQIRRIVSARTPEAVWHELAAALKPFGFDRILYGATSNRREGSVGDIQDVVSFTTITRHPGRGREDMSFFIRTPMFRWVMNNSGASSWRWAEEQFAKGLLTPDEVAARDLARKSGLCAGYVISFEEPGSRRAAALSMIAAPDQTQDSIDAMWAEKGDEIIILAQTMHLKIQSMPLKVHRRALSPRQREALEWVAEGKTSQDIAIIMGISPGMVEKHLRLARECLDVDTTAQAVAKAAMFNHLYANPTGEPKR